MPLNLELKASVPSIQSARESAVRCGARFQGTLHQVDTYFNVARGRLKLREIGEQGAELIYYERAETASERWSNYSRVAVPDPTVLKQQLAAALGILVVVRKKRELFFLERIRIHLDEVEGLGSFLEIEIPVVDAQEASRKMQHVREWLGVEERSIFTASYSDLIRGKSAGFGT